MGQMLGSTKPTELSSAVSSVVQSPRECRVLLEQHLELFIGTPGKARLVQPARDSSCYEEKRIGIRDTDISMFSLIHMAFSRGTVPVPETSLAQELGTAFFVPRPLYSFVLIIR